MLCGMLCMCYYRKSISTLREDVRDNVEMLGMLLGIGLCVSPKDQEVGLRSMSVGSKIWFVDDCYLYIVIISHLLIELVEYHSCVCASLWLCTSSSPNS